MTKEDFEDFKDFKVYLIKRIDREYKKCKAAGGSMYGWKFKVGEWGFTIDYCRDLGCVLGHCSTRCQVERKILDKENGVYTWDYNIYTWDQYRDGRVFNGMATWIWNRM